MLGKYKLSKHEAVIEEYDHHETLVTKTRIAYADVEPQASDGWYGTHDQCYHFTTPGWFTDGIALRCAFDAIDGAGSFDAEEVTPVTRGLQQRIGYIRIAIARWEYPMLYVETDYPAEVRDRLSEVASDVKGVPDGKVGVCTRYHNHHNNLQHEPCPRDVPVVPWYDEAEPEEHKDVVAALFS